MKVLLLECKEIFDIRLLLILLFFTVIFYHLYMQVLRYPHANFGTASEYDIPFEMELVQEWGPTLNARELNKVAEKEAELMKEVDPVVASNEVLKKVGIHDFKQLKEIQCDLVEKDRLTGQEAEIIKAYDDIFFETSDDISKICFELQVLSRLTESIGWEWDMDESQANNLLDSYGDSIYRNEKVERMTTDYTSLNSYGAMYILRKDVRLLLVLIIIGNFVATISYQVKERLSGVLPIYVVCAGRGIFGKQLAASVLSCGILGAVQTICYLVLYWAKGLGAFWGCPAWTTYDSFYWPVPNFGWYAAVHLLLVWLVATASSVIVYLIGRAAVNYIAGIAISIPAGLVLSFSFMALFIQLFSYEENPLPPYWEVWVSGGFVLGCAMVGIARLWRDRRRDYLCWK